MFFRLSCYSSVPITILAFILLLMSFCFFFFFFQAEDGIRDTSVTGVQTCALPICGGGCPGAGAPLPRRACDRGYGERSAADGRDRRGQRRERQALAPPRRPRARSEERRVGKECRSRWSRCHEKKKEEKRESRKER